MIDFAATRPHEIRTDSLQRHWQGFRVVRRLAQAPAELVLDPAEVAPGLHVPTGTSLSLAARAGDIRHDYLVSLNRGLAGRTAFEVDGRWHKLDAGPSNWMIHPSGLPGRYIWSKPADAVHLLLAQDWVDQVASDLSDNRVKHLVLPPLCSIDVPGYFGALDQLAALVENSPVHDTLHAERLAHAFLAHLLDCSTDLTQGRRRRTERLALSSLRRVLDLVDALMDGNLTLDILAQQTGMSAFHFARAFRNTTGCPPHQYVLKRRLERAHGLLAGTKREVTDVAMACGFATPSHLAAAFHRQYGISPSALKETR